MEIKTDLSNPGSNYIIDTNSSAALPPPPPYTDEPPAYTPMASSNTYNYPETNKIPLDMEQPTVPNVYPPLAAELHNYPQQPSCPPMIHQQSPNQPAIIIHQSNHPIITSHPKTTLGGQHHNLLHVSPNHIVQTAATGRRKTESHVTDFETGKQYVIKERTSRLGLRSKTVIQEVGGPKTIVRETPFKTIVRQKKW